MGYKVMSLQNLSSNQKPFSMISLFTLTKLSSKCIAVKLILFLILKLPFSTFEYTN